MSTKKYRATYNKLANNVTVKIGFSGVLDTIMVH